MAKKLLLVEDDEATLDTLSSFLHLRNHRTVSSRCVAGAIDILEKDPEIGIVLTDLRMPGPDGFDMIRSADNLARNTGRTVPVIVVTGHGTQEDEQQAMALGARCFLRKPIDLRQLLAEIDRHTDILPGHSDVQDR